MPELPEIELYLHALVPRIQGQVLEKVRSEQGRRVGIPSARGPGGEGKVRG